MPQVVLLRHGESVWNNENLFTGWTDVDLSADQQIIDLNIPTGVPLVYELDGNLASLRHYYLEDVE
jgi:bisphosphoglycerate-dependent phosphoglycerate mutase